MTGFINSSYFCQNQSSKDSLHVNRSANGEWTSDKKAPTAGTLSDI